MKATWTVALWALAAVTAQGQVQDVVHVMDREGKVTPVRGVVESMTCEAVRVRVGETGIPQDIPPTSIVRLEIRGGHPSLGRGLRLMEEGRLEEALQRLEEVGQMERAPSWCRQAAWWYAAECLLRLGRVQQALAALDRVVQVEPNAYYLMGIAERRVEIHLARNEAAQANAAVGALQAHERQHRRHDWLGQIGLLQGRIARAQRDWSSALSAYRGLVSHENAAVRLEAQILEIRTLLDMGNVNEAAARGRSVIDSGRERDHSLLRVAYNATGAAHLARQEPKEALKAFLRGVLMYTDGIPHAEHEYALAQAAIAAWRTASVVEPAARAEYQDHARALLRELQAQYPNSSWLAQVRSELGAR